MAAPKLNMNLLHVLRLRATRKLPREGIMVLDYASDEKAALEWEARCLSRRMVVRLSATGLPPSEAPLRQILVSEETDWERVRATLAQMWAFVHAVAARYARCCLVVDHTFLEEMPDLRFPFDMRMWSVHDVLQHAVDGTGPELEELHGLL